MKFFLNRISIIFLFFFFITSALSATGFVVQRIQIKGLENLKSSTVRSHMPVKEGQRFTYSRSNLVLKELYDSGFFYTVGLGQRGSTLVVTVKERPMVSEVKVTGNEEISTSKIQPVLKKLGVAIGEIYDPMKIKLFNTSLEQQYNMMGYAATSVTSEIKKLSHNRVAIYIHVNEGKIVKVNSIKFIGNNTFSDGKLRGQMALTTPGIFTWFTHKDRYSPYKLDQDLEKLTNFYLNNGYVRFRIVRKEVKYIKGHKRVNIVITVDEGSVYHISHVQLMGQTLGYETEVKKLFTVKVGQVFSRSKIIGTERAVNNFYADKAYAFNRTSVVPSIDDEAHTVSIGFNVIPGKKVYVRRIHFGGNNTTDQEVFRRELRQMEASPYSLTRVNESKRHIMLTTFVENVDVNTVPVLGTNNQVDLNFNLKERPAGKASLQGGYSSAFGFLYGASISQPNFMGSGRAVSIGFTNSQQTQQYSFSYFNPYYKWYGLGRGVSVFYNRNKYSKSFGYTPYVMNTLGASVKYILPLSDSASFGMVFGYGNIDLRNIAVQNSLEIPAGQNPGPYVMGFAPSVLNFLRVTRAELTSNNVKREYNNFKVDASWSYDGRDRGVMPTKGFMNSVGAEFGVPVLNSSLRYYTVSANFIGYVPLFHGFILNFLGNFGYGNSFGANRYLNARGETQPSTLPFLFNFHAGGIGTVPGYMQNTLGPKYALGSNIFNALGGNLLTTAGVHLILPNFISNSLRIALTFDAGNVFQAPVYRTNNQAQCFTNTLSGAGTSVQTSCTPPVAQQDAFALKNMRMSAGLLVTWVIPGVAPIDLSLAFPLNPKKGNPQDKDVVNRVGDQTEYFQFAMGVSF